MLLGHRLRGLCFRYEDVDLIALDTSLCRAVAFQEDSYSIVYSLMPFPTHSKMQRTDL